MGVVLVVEGVVLVVGDDVVTVVVVDSVVEVVVLLTTQNPCSQTCKTEYQTRHDKKKKI